MSDAGTCRCGAAVDEAHSPDCADLIDSRTPMCACGHTVEGHTAEGCFGCAGPKCDIAMRDAVARVLYAAFGRYQTFMTWDQLTTSRTSEVAEHFYGIADRLITAVATYGSPDDLANACDDAEWSVARHVAASLPGIPVYIDGEPGQVEA